MSDRRAQLSLFWLILASVAVAVFGFVSMGLWIPTVMMFDAPGAIENKGTIALAIILAGGPVVSVAALIVCWVRVGQMKRASGLKWMLALPALWLVTVFIGFTALSVLCDGEFSCGA